MHALNMDSLILNSLAFLSQLYSRFLCFDSDDLSSSNVGYCTKGLEKALLTNYFKQQSNEYYFLSLISIGVFDIGITVVGNLFSYFFNI